MAHKCTRSYREMNELLLKNDRQNIQQALNFARAHRTEHFATLVLGLSRLSRNAENNSVIIELLDEAIAAHPESKSWSI